MTTFLNLLPAHYQRRQLVRRRLIVWASVWTGLLALGAVLFMSRVSDYRQGLSRLEERRRAAAPLIELNDEVEQLEKRIDELRNRERLALQLAQEQPALTLLGIVSAAARDCQGNVCVQHFVLDTAQREEATIRTMKLTGLGVDNLSVARFVASLRDALVFDQVELKSAEERPMGDVTARFYELECVY